MINILKDFTYKRVSYKEGTKKPKSPFSTHEELVLKSQGLIEVIKPKKSTKKSNKGKKDDQNEDELQAQKE